MNIENVFFTSDLHFSHKNIIEFCKRPFLDVNEMNRVLIENWNAMVPSDGEVYILGDMFFENDIQIVINILNSLNGKKYYIKGNHDKVIFKVKEYFEWIRDYYEINFNNRNIVLSHYPMIEWNHFYRNGIQLFGHVHGKLDGKCHKNQLDVGVDSHNFTPISLETILKKLQ